MQRTYMETKVSATAHLHSLKTSYQQRSLFQILLFPKHFGFWWTLFPDQCFAPGPHCLPNIMHPPC